MKRINIILLLCIFIYQPIVLAAEVTNYEDGIKEVKEYINQSNFKEAESLIRLILIKYPDNSEFQEILAKILFWEKKYDESINVYQKIIEKNNTKDIQEELKKVKTSKEIELLDRLKGKISSSEYEKRVLELYKSGSDNYSTGYMLGNYYISQREFTKAANVFKSLNVQYSDDTDIKLLYLESLLDSKDYSSAKDFYNTLKEKDISYIKQNRDDLIYRLQRNYALIKGGYYFYPSELQNERELTFEVSQGYKNFTFAPRYSNISRFGLNDNQFGLVVYSTLGERRWGYLSVTGSPDAEFLPVWSAGAEFYQGIGITEVSLGYNRVNFKDLGVNVVKPGVRFYLPYNFAIEEKLNFVPEQLAFMLMSTVNYEPNHKFNAYYSLGIGQIAERINSIQDLQKVNTYIHTLGVQYRFIPQLSLNTELLYNHREGLYDIKGASLFAKYWW